MAWVRECPKCGKQRVYNRDTGTCYECAQAPKEEEMGVELFDTPDDDFDMEQEMKADHTTELRAVYREAYMAALGGACADTNVPNPVKDARMLALETVRQWAAMMAELEQEIAK